LPFVYFVKRLEVIENARVDFPWDEE